MFSRTALGTDEVTCCLRQHNAEGSKRATSTLSCQPVPVPQHDRLAITVVIKQRGRSVSLGEKKTPKHIYIYIYVFPLLSHLHLDGRFTSKEKVERQNMCYSQLNIQKLTNYQIQFQISKIELLSALIS